MVNATEWINQNYPVNGTCQRVEDKENYGKTRSQITELDVSNNLLTNLDVWGTRDLVELNCSSNPFLTNFSFSSLSNLKSFDCLGVKFTKSDNIVSPTSTALATATVYTDNPALFSNTIGLGIYSGISTLGWLALAFVFFYKRFWWKAFIPTPGS